MCQHCGRRVIYAQITITPLASRAAVSELWCAHCLADLLGCRPLFAYQEAPRQPGASSAVQVFGPGGVPVTVSE